MVMAKKSKMAMMLGTTFLAASTVLSPVHADTKGAAVPHTTIEAAVQPELVMPIADHADQKASPLANRLGLIGLAGGILAVLVKLIGVNKVMRVIKGSARKAAKVATATAEATVGAAARVMRSPLRYVAWTAGLFLFAITGISVFDLEWVGGLIVGASLSGILCLGLWKTRLALRPVRAHSSSKRNMDNGN